MQDVLYIEFRERLLLKCLSIDQADETSDPGTGDWQAVRRVKHFADRMALPKSNVITLPTLPERVDRAYFDEIMEDMTAGRVLTVKDVANRLKASVDKAREEIKSQPGHFKVGSDYRLPECAFRRLMMRRVGLLN